MRAALTRNRSLVLALLVFALAVRLVGLNFDQSHFYHPDERRIAEAVTQLSLRPLQLNPHFFAYGSFPFYVTKLVTAGLANFDRWFSTYDGAVLTGRALSALWGTATVLLLFALGRRLYGTRTGLLAGALLAATVLHVQNSHFATTDVPLTFLVLLALALMVEVVEYGRPAAYAAAGAAVGLAVATKFSALPLLLPLAVAAAFRARSERTVRRAAAGLALGCACAAAGFFVGEPYAILDARGWLHDILEQSRMVRHAGLVPYTTQYIGVPKVIYDLREMVVWGMGPLLGIAALVGTAARLRRWRSLSGAEWVLLAWVLPFFAVTCSFDVKFVRYLLPIYPLVVLWGAAWLQRWAERGAAGRWVRGAVVAGTGLYLLAFLAIYTRPHAAVTATEWFDEHATPGARVVIQDWDEGFPFSLPGRPAERYKVTAFPFYEPDTAAKIQRLAADLAASDWLVLQTKRLYGAVTRAPAKYPLTDNFFRELFAGDLGYTLVEDVASRPSLFGIELPDELADESFSVYDHPKALIFRNTGHTPAAALAGEVLNGLPSHPVSRSAMLLARAGAPATGGEHRVRSSPAATVLCALLLELLGLAAFAVMRWALPPRPGLYALAKVMGVLVFVYVPWLAVSLGLASFAPPVLWGTLVAIAAAGWALRRRDGGGPSRREVTASEAVFWGAFALFLLLRALNPEIFWGEKPMDFSFLNTLYRTQTLPPPEPWFAGSPLLYTYFGHYAIAAIGKTLAIQPAVMFNLGIAAVAGLTAAALFAAGSLLGGGWRVGVATTALTLLLGNLSGVRELLERHAVNFDYFWATSRVIPNTINEYPFWSFTFADLHAHLLVMPWAVGFVAVAILWLGRRGEPTPRRPRTAAAALLALGALSLGAVTVTNGWSLPTYVALLLALLIAEWAAHGLRGGIVRSLRTGLTTVVAPAAVVIGGAALAFRPFWRHFSPPASQWGAEVGPFARPTDVLTIFGVFLALLVPFLFATWRRVLAPDGGPLGRLRRAAMIAAGAGLALSLLDLGALAHLAVRQAPSIRTFALAMAAFGAYLALHRATPERDRRPLLLAAFAFALVAGCEFVFIWDRMNTVFKFYLEAWLLLGLACGPVFCGLFRRDRPHGAARLAWRGLVGAAATVGAFTSISGAWGAVTHRHTPGPRWTLDGMAYLRTTDPQDLAAFEWINRNVPGLPVLAEAYGPSYGAYARVAMNTGLPIVLGWDYHVYQRGHRWPEINRRKSDLETIFTAADEARVAAVLRHDHVALIYVGALERRTYAGGNLADFERWTDLLTPVYRNPGVTIFAVNGGALGTPPPLEVEPEVAGAEPAAAPAALGVLSQPRGIACDREGDVYVADFGNCRIEKFDRGLKAVAAWGRRGTAPGEFRDPCGVAVGPDGRVYVADTWNGRVQVFDAAGRYLREFGANLYGPRGVAVDGAGRAWVADTGNNRIERYSPDGKQDLVIDPPAPPGKLAGPQGIALDSGGRVYVCDNDNGRLAVFDADGAFLRAFPVPGWRREVFSEPYVALAPGGTIWVTVPLAGEVRAYAADGRLLRTIRGDDAPAPGFKRPSGIALSPAGGAVLVSDIEGRLAVAAGSAP
jgi:YYY domain-containing protein